MYLSIKCSNKGKNIRNSNFTSKDRIQGVFPQTIYTIHIYYANIHNWSLQPFSHIIGLVSHTTYVVCVNFIHKWRDLQFKVGSERPIFLRNFSWQFYLLSEFLLRGNRRFLYFVSMPGLGMRNPGFIINKPTHYLLDDYGDFTFTMVSSTIYANNRFLMLKVKEFS